jgi:hypothetical protein
MTIMPYGWGKSVFRRKLWLDGSVSSHDWRLSKTVLIQKKKIQFISSIGSLPIGFARGRYGRSASTWTQPVPMHVDSTGPHALRPMLFEQT